MKYHLPYRSVRKMWASAKSSMQNGEAVSFKKKQRKGRTDKKQPDFMAMESLPVQERATIRKLAKGLHCSKSTVGAWIKSKQIKPHTNAIKPELTDANKHARLCFCLQALNVHRAIETADFSSMHNIVHIDEKWFYLTKPSHRYYLTPMEPEPHRVCKSKTYIKKVMFMCAVSRPIWGRDGALLFDGKIGIFPFIQQVPAQRSSKNRVAGTVETKTIESVTKQVIKDCLINQIIPAIKEKWPAHASKTIYIQQDNAKPHIKGNDADFIAAATSNDFNIKLIQQPPNSPDMNINDLGWFRAIQSLQTEHSCKNEEQLVQAVKASFSELTAETLNKVFLTLQGCMREVIKCRGHNTYKIPHMKKDSLARQNNLPIQLSVPMQLVHECIQEKMEKGQVQGLESIMAALAY